MIQVFLFIVYSIQSKPSSAYEKYFFLIMSLTIGYYGCRLADNWLYDLDQPSNSNQKILISSLFCLCCFRLLLTQSALIRIEELAFS